MPQSFLKKTGLKSKFLIMKKSNVSIQSINAENSGLVLFQPEVHLDSGELTMEVESLNVHPSLHAEFQTILEASQNSQNKDFAHLTLEEQNLRRIQVSMGLIGQTTPITVTKVDSEIYVIDGLYRLVAAKELLRWKDIKVAIIQAPEDNYVFYRLLSRATQKRSHFDMARDSYELRKKLSKLRGKERNAEAVGQIVGIVGLTIPESALSNLNSLSSLLLGLSFKKTTMDDLLFLYEENLNEGSVVVENQVFEKLDSGEISISNAAKQVRELMEIDQKRTIDVPTVFENFPISENDPRHLVIEGDSQICPDSIMDESVNLILTSFEYVNDLKNYDQEGEERFDTIGQVTSVEEYTGKVVRWCHQYREKLTIDGSLVMVVSEARENGVSLGISSHLILGMKEDGWFFREDIIWQKSNNRYQKSTTHLQSSGEHILVFSRTAGEIKFNQPYWFSEPATGWGTSNQPKDGLKQPKKYLKRSKGLLTNLIDAQKMEGVLTHSVFGKSEIMNYGQTDHPCPFPWTLAAMVILLYTNKDDTVLDICGGIGSTAHAAKVLGRKSISIELRSRFVDYIRNRMSLNGDEVLNEEELMDIQGQWTGEEIVSTYEIAA
jgi:DNA modification methylase